MPPVQTLEKEIAREERSTEQVPDSDPRAEVLSIDPERMWGTPCFVGTRLPIKSLFDHLASGVSLDEFIESFGGISRETCVRTLELAYQFFLEGLPDGQSTP